MVFLVTKAALAATLVGIGVTFGALSYLAQQGRENNDGTTGGKGFEISFPSKENPPTSSSQQNSPSSSSSFSLFGVPADCNCKVVTECSTLPTGRQFSFRFGRTCGFQGFQRKVCCDEVKFFNTPPPLFALDEIKSVQAQLAISPSTCVHNHDEKGDFSTCSCDHGDDYFSAFGGSGGGTNEEAGKPPGSLRDDNVIEEEANTLTPVVEDTTQEARRKISFPDLKEYFPDDANYQDNSSSSPLPFETALVPKAGTTTAEVNAAFEESKPGSTSTSSPNFLSSKFPSLEEYFPDENSGSQSKLSTTEISDGGVGGITSKTNDTNATTPHEDVTTTFKSTLPDADNDQLETTTVAILANNNAENVSTTGSSKDETVNELEHTTADPDIDIRLGTSSRKDEEVRTVISVIMSVETTITSAFEMATEASTMNQVSSSSTSQEFPDVTEMVIHGSQTGTQRPQSLELDKSATVNDTNTSSIPATETTTKSSDIDTTVAPQSMTTLGVPSQDEDTTTTTTEESQNNVTQPTSETTTSSSSRDRKPFSLDDRIGDLENGGEQQQATTIREEASQDPTTTLLPDEHITTTIANKVDKTTATPDVTKVEDTTAHFEADLTSTSTLFSYHSSMTMTESSTSTSVPEASTNKETEITTENPLQSSTEEGETTSSSNLPEQERRGTTVGAQQDQLIEESTTKSSEDVTTDLPISDTTPGSSQVHLSTNSTSITEAVNEDSNVASTSSPSPPDAMKGGITDRPLSEKTTTTTEPLSELTTVSNGGEQDSSFATTPTPSLDTENELVPEKSSTTSASTSHHPTSEVEEASPTGGSPETTTEKGTMSEETSPQSLFKSSSTLAPETTTSLADMDDSEEMPNFYEVPDSPSSTTMETSIPEATTTLISAGGEERRSTMFASLIDDITSFLSATTLPPDETDETEKPSTTNQIEVMSLKDEEKETGTTVKASEEVTPSSTTVAAAPTETSPDEHLTTTTSRVSESSELTAPLDGTTMPSESIQKSSDISATTISSDSSTTSNVEETTTARMELGHSEKVVEEVTESTLTTSSPMEADSSDGERDHTSTTSPEMNDEQLRSSQTTTIRVDGDSSTAAEQMQDVTAGTLKIIEIQVTTPKATTEEAGEGISQGNTSSSEPAQESATTSAPEEGSTLTPFVTSDRPRSTEISSDDEKSTRISVETTTEESILLSSGSTEKSSDNQSQMETTTLQGSDEDHMRTSSQSEATTTPSSHNIEMGVTTGAPLLDDDPYKIASTFLSKTNDDSTSTTSHLDELFNNGEVPTSTMETLKPDLGTTVKIDEEGGRMTTFSLDTPTTAAQGDHVEMDDDISTTTQSSSSFEATGEVPTGRRIPSTPSISTESSQMEEITTEMGRDATTTSSSLRQSNDQDLELVSTTTESDGENDITTAKPELPSTGKPQSVMLETTTVREATTETSLDLGHTETTSGSLSTEFTTKQPDVMSIEVVSDAPVQLKDSTSKTVEEEHFPTTQRGEVSMTPSSQEFMTTESGRVTASPGENEREIRTTSSAELSMNDEMGRTTSQPISELEANTMLADMKTENEMSTVSVQTTESARISTEETTTKSRKFEASTFSDAITTVKAMSDVTEQQSTSTDPGMAQSLLSRDIEGTTESSTPESHDVETSSKREEVTRETTLSPTTETPLISTESTKVTSSLSTESSQNEEITTGMSHDLMSDLSTEMPASTFSSLRESIEHEQESTTPILATTTRSPEENETGKTITQGHGKSSQHAETEMTTTTSSSLRQSNDEQEAGTTPSLRTTTSPGENEKGMTATSTAELSMNDEMGSTTSPSVPELEATTILADMKTENDTPTITTPSAAVPATESARVPTQTADMPGSKFETTTESREFEASTFSDGITTVKAMSNVTEQQSTSPNPATSQSETTTESTTSRKVPEASSSSTESNQKEESTTQMAYDLTSDGFTDMPTTTSSSGRQSTDPAQESTTLSPATTHSPVEDEMGTTTQGHKGHSETPVTTTEEAVTLAGKSVQNDEEDSTLSSVTSATRESETDSSIIATDGSTQKDMLEMVTTTTTESDGEKDITTAKPELPSTGKPQSFMLETTTVRETTTETSLDLGHMETTSGSPSTEVTTNQPDAMSIEVVSDAPVQLKDSTSKTDVEEELFPTTQRGEVGMTPLSQEFMTTESGPVTASPAENGSGMTTTASDELSMDDQVETTTTVSSRESSPEASKMVTELSTSSENPSTTSNVGEDTKETTTMLPSSLPEMHDEKGEITTSKSATERIDEAITVKSTSELGENIRSTTSPSEYPTTGIPSNKEDNLEVTELPTEKSTTEAQEEHKVRETTDNGQDDVVSDKPTESSNMPTETPHGDLEQSSILPDATSKPDGAVLDDVTPETTAPTVKDTTEISEDRVNDITDNSISTTPTSTPGKVETTTSENMEHTSLPSLINANSEDPALNELDSFSKPPTSTVASSEIDSTTEKSEPIHEKGASSDKSPEDITVQPSTLPPDFGVTSSASVENLPVTESDSTTSHPASSEKEESSTSTPISNSSFDEITTTGASMTKGTAEESTTATPNELDSTKVEKEAFMETTTAAGGTNLETTVGGLNGAEEASMITTTSQPGEPFMDEEVRTSTMETLKTDMGTTTRTEEERIRTTTSTSNIPTTTVQEGHSEMDDEASTTTQSSSAFETTGEVPTGRRIPSTPSISTESSQMEDTTTEMGHDVTTTSSALSNDQEHETTTTSLRTTASPRESEMSTASTNELSMNDDVGRMTSQPVSDLEATTVFSGMNAENEMTTVSVAVPTTGSGVTSTESPDMPASKFETTTNSREFEASTFSDGMTTTVNGLSDVTEQQSTSTDPGTAQSLLSRDIEGTTESSTPESHDVETSSKREEVTRETTLSPTTETPLISTESTKVTESISTESSQNEEITTGMSHDLMSELSTEMPMSTFSMRESSEQEQESTTLTLATTTTLSPEENEMGTTTTQGHEGQVETRVTTTEDTATGKSGQDQEAPTTLSSVTLSPISQTTQDSGTDASITTDSPTQSDMMDESDITSKPEQGTTGKAESFMLETTTVRETTTETSLDLGHTETTSGSLSTEVTTNRPDAMSIEVVSDSPLELKDSSTGKSDVVEDEHFTTTQRGELGMTPSTQEIMTTEGGPVTASPEESGSGMTTTASDELSMGDQVETTTAQSVPELEESTMLADAKSENEITTVSDVIPTTESGVISTEAAEMSVSKIDTTTESEEVETSTLSDGITTTLNGLSDVTEHEQQSTSHPDPVTSQSLLSSDVGGTNENTAQTSTNSKVEESTLKHDFTTRTPFVMEEDEHTTSKDDNELKTTENVLDDMMIMLDSPYLVSLSTQNNSLGEDEMIMTEASSNDTHASYAGTTEYSDSSDMLATDTSFSTPSSSSMDDESTMREDEMMWPVTEITKSVRREPDKDKTVVELVSMQSRVKSRTKVTKTVNAVRTGSERSISEYTTEGTSTTTTDGYSTTPPPTSTFKLTENEEEEEGLTTTTTQSLSSSEDDDARPTLEPPVSWMVEVPEDNSTETDVIMMDFDGGEMNETIMFDTTTAGIVLNATDASLFDEATTTTLSSQEMDEGGHATSTISTSENDTTILSDENDLGDNEMTTNFSGGENLETTTYSMLYHIKSSATTSIPLLDEVTSQAFTEPVMSLEMENGTDTSTKLEMGTTTPANSSDSYITSPPTTERSEVRNESVTFTSTLPPSATDKSENGVVFDDFTTTATESSTAVDFEIHENATTPSPSPASSSSYDEELYDTIFGSSSRSRFPNSSNLVSESEAASTTSRTTTTSEPAFTVEVKVGPHDARSLFSSQSTSAEKALEGEISNVVSQLLLTTHKHFNLLPSFVECAGARARGRRKTRVLHFDTDNYPWMARVGYKEPGGVTFPCAGTIISRRYILTSAYCATRKSNAADPSIMEVLLEGAKNAAAGLSDQLRYKYKVEQVVPHPNFDPLTRENDLALIRLGNEIPFNTSTEIKPICLPFEDGYGVWDSLPNEGETAYLGGWGYGLKSMAAEVEKMDEAAVTIWSTENCTHLYRGDRAKRITPKNICAFGKAEKDSCRGDIGGPLMALMTRQRIFFQIGIVSYGPRCGYGVPGVYTRVSPYLSWILDSMEP